jgi:hypothetical protein
VTDECEKNGRIMDIWVKLNKLGGKSSPVPIDSLLNLHDVTLD